MLATVIDFRKLEWCKRGTSNNLTLKCRWYAGVPARILRN